MNRALFFLVILLAAATTLHAQLTNIDFETGTYAVWKYYTGSCCPIITPTGGTSTPTTGRHTLTTSSGTDPYCGFSVVSPWGGSYSMKLGNDGIGSQAERCRYYVHIPTGAIDYSLIYHYAIVLNDPAHAPPQQSRMEIRAYDSATGLAAPCDSISYVTAPGLPGFFTASSSSAGAPIYCRQWTMGKMKLFGLGGHTIAVDFATGDCGYGGHWAYGYVDMQGELYANVMHIPCSATTPIVTLSGPYGYAAYSWRDSTTFATVYGSTQNVTITATGTSTTYAVILTPYAGYGCKDTLYTRVIDSSTSSGSVTIPGRSLCIGDTTTFITGGSGLWSSDVPSVATIGSSTGLVTGIAAGMTAITYTVSSGCTRVSSITVTPTPAIITGDSVFCIGTTGALSNTVAGGAWSSGNTAIATVGTGSGVVTPVAVGIVTISYTMPGGCYRIKNVTVNTQPSIIGGVASVCVGATTVLSNTVPGGIWSSGATGIATIGSASGIVSGITTGTAVITYSIGTCYKTIIVTVNPAPSAIAGLPNICVGTTTTLTNSVAGGTWSSSNPPVATVGSGSGVVTGIAAGTAIISYTMPGGCYTTKYVTINLLPSAIAGVASICVGATTTLTNTVPGGTWSSGATSIATVGSASGIVIGVSAGTAIITYSLGTCYKTITATVNPTPATIAGAPSICVGATTTLTNSVAGGTWSSGTPPVATVGSGSGVVTGMAAGTAIISYTMPGGCYTTKYITVNPQPAAIGSIPSMCVGATTTLTNTVPGGVWISGAPGIATVGSASGIVTGVAAGAAVITYALGPCYKTIIVNITPSPGAIIGITNICAGNTTALTNSAGGGVWSSSNTAVATVGSNTGVVTGIAAGTATVTYMLSGGCYKTVLITVISLPAAGTITGPSSVCAGQTITLINTTGSGVWSSSNLAIATVGSTGVINGISAGVVTISYTVTYTCGSATATKSITVNLLPAPITGGWHICGYDTLMLADSVTGGMWSSSNIAVATVGPSGIVTGTPSGTVIITYTMPGGCYVTKMITVDALPDAGIITHNGFLAFCIGDQLGLEDTTVGGVWSIANGNAVLSGSTLTAVTPGTDTVFYIISNSCGADTAVFPFIISPPPSPPYGNLIICVGDTTILKDSISGGFWYGFGPIILYTPFYDSAVVIGKAEGIGTIKFSIDWGCSVTIQITVNPSPSAGTITGQSMLCMGAKAIMLDSVSGGIWTSTDTTTAVIDTNGFVTAKDTGNTFIIYTVPPNIYGCIATDTFLLSVILPEFTVTGTVTDVQCYDGADGKIELNKHGANNVYHYLWSPGGATTVTVQHLAAGVYSVSVTDTASQCTVTESFTITLPDSLSATFSTQKDLCKMHTGSIVANLSGGTAPYKYLWQNSATSNDISKLAAGNYGLSVTDFNNCTKTYIVTITDTDCNDLIIYNAFSPNGDGINDTWVIEGIELYPKNNVQVYDKWGDKVFEATWYKNDWAGAHLPDGTYYYLIKLNAPNQSGGDNVFKGSLLIKR